MSYQVKLADGTMFDLDESTGSKSLRIKVATQELAVEAYRKMTDFNLSKYQFLVDGVVTGEYTGMTLKSMEPYKNGIVTFNLIETSSKEIEELIKKLAIAEQKAREAESRAATAESEATEARAEKAEAVERAEAAERTVQEEAQQIALSAVGEERKGQQIESITQEQVQTTEALQTTETELHEMQFELEKANIKVDKAEKQAADAEARATDAAQRAVEAEEIADANEEAATAWSILTGEEA